MNKQDFLNSGLLEQYLLGLLVDQKDINLVKQYLDNDQEISRLYKEMEQTMVDIADSNGIAPPDHLKSKILSKLAKKSIPKSSGYNIWPYFMGLFVLCGIALGLKYRKVANELEQQKKAYQVLEEDCMKSAIEQATFVEFAKGPSVKSVQINDASLTMTALYDKSNGQVYINSPSMTPPEGKCFVLWGDKDHKMIKIGRLDQINDHIVKIDPEMVSLNVTIENATIDVKQPDVSNLVGSVAI